MLPVCERPGGGGRLGAGRFREGNGEIHHHPRYWTIRRLADPHRREPLHRLPAPTLGISLGKYNAGKYNAANIELGFGTQGILNVGYSRKF